MRRDLAALVARGAENPRRVEAPAEDRRHASDRTVAALLSRQRHERLVERTLRAPVERGVGVEYLQPAH